MVLVEFFLKLTSRYGKMWTFLEKPSFRITCISFSGSLRFPARKEKHTPCFHCLKILNSISRRRDGQDLRQSHPGECGRREAVVETKDAAETDDEERKTYKTGGLTEIKGWILKTIQKVN